MDNRYRNSNSQQGRDRYARPNRQSEQFSIDSDNQYGETDWRNQSGGDRWQSGGGDFGRGYDRNENQQREDFTRGGGGYGADTSSLDDYDRQGAARSSRRDTSHSYFRPDDYGGADYSGGRVGGVSRSSNYGASGYGANMYDRGGAGSIPPRQYDRDERGFFDRASDEVMSWFGDDDAARRRQMDSREDHRGKGPAGYTRSKERILEDANERLMRDSSIDASNVTVTCEDNEITLTGTVNSRSAKRRAEDIVDDISGVKHVQNNLRVETADSYHNTTASSTDKKPRTET